MNYYINYIKDFVKLFLEFLSDLLLFRSLSWIYNNKIAYTIVIALLAFGYVQGKDYWPEYKAEYDRLNSDEEKEDDEEHMEFVEIADGLYTMTGGIGSDDCNRIVKDMPTDKHFTVILESPGGNLAEGSCLASHLKIRNVNTVVRNTPVYNEENKIIYQPGLIDSGDKPEGTVMCASACGLLFLAGDSRYLIGDVFLGIHGPSTPPGSGPKNPQQAEQQILQTASKLLDLLEELGVEDPDVRQLFIQIPSYTMYWLKPTEFQLREGLINIATHYRDFWGYTGSNHSL